MKQSHYFWSTAILLASTLLFFISGCSMAPSAQEYASADYGQPITQEEAQEQAARFMHGQLKDPESARYECAPIQTGWSKDGLVYGGQTHFGYALLCAVNAKNSYGAYAGAERYQFLFHNGSLVTVMKFGSDGINMKLL